jgi:hypothetical protein
VIAAVVSLVEMVTVSKTGFIGLAMNLISSCCFTCAAAFVYQNGELLHEITLSLSNDGEIVLDGNRIRIINGEIGVIEASCPDKLCVKTGFVSAKRAVPVICLPNRVEIRIKSRASDIDGITQ